MEYTTGTRVFHDWIIVRKIGQGTIGNVYEIKKEGYGEEIRSALKVIRIPQSQSDIKEAVNEGMTKNEVIDYFRKSVDEILREIQIMASLKEHPNIVAYEDHCVVKHENEIGWDILIKMELLTPFQKWQMEHLMEDGVIVRLGCEISKALSYMADHGFVHRDVKPENIYVDSLGKFKLGDFEITGTIEKINDGLVKIGTECYMAPEVYLGKEYNVQADVYSLGVVLYRLLNHDRLPFYPPITEKITEDDRKNALMRRIQGLPVPEPANGSAELKAVVLKACEYLPENRYANMNEFHDALQNVEKRPEVIHPNQIPPNQTPSDPDKHGNRRKWMIGIAGVAVIATASVAAIDLFHKLTKKIELTVEDGTGSGEYKAGEKVEVTAEAEKEGQIFSRWQIADGIEHSDETKETMEIVMPEEDIQIAAEYVNRQYELTVDGGTGSGKYEAGSRVKIVADDSKEERGIFEFYMDPSSSDVEYDFTSLDDNEYEITMPEQNVKIEIKELDVEEIVARANGFLEDEQYEDAVKLYQAAADQNNAEALYQLGYCYYNAYGVEEDKEKSFELTRESAELGYAEAQYQLGYFYYSGDDGFTQDYEEAIRWYKKAADQNYAEAQCNLAVCYLIGYGGDVDTKEVEELFKKAAEQANPPAEYYLGWCYENAYGIDTDYEQALYWYKKAADDGLEVAEDAANELEKVMEDAASEEKRTELSEYLYCTTDDIKAIFGEPLSEGWANGVDYLIYDDYEFDSMYSEYNEKLISRMWLKNNSTEYELCGINVQMSENEAEHQLLENGFFKLETGVFYNGEDKFVTLEKEFSYEENKEGGMDRKESDTLCVRVSVLRESLHPDKTEVFHYMKCSLGKVVTDIPDLEIYEKDDQTVIAEKKGIRFEAEKQGGDWQQAVIRRILVVGSDTDYCLYGITPEDFEYAGDYLAFEEGGSGELIDPAGSILYLWDRLDEKSAVSLWSYQ